MRIAFLGPPGTFTEEALASQPDLAAAERIAALTIDASIAAVVAGTVDAALVPIENSTTGPVEQTRVELARHTDLAVVREVEITVHQDLLAVAGAELAGITLVISHEEALRQCARYLARHLPGARTETSPSTAEAARQVRKRGSPEVAAIASGRAAGAYGLQVLARGIEDGASNRTRFVLIAKRPPAADEPAAD